MSYDPEMCCSFTTRINHLLVRVTLDRDPNTGEYVTHCEEVDDKGDCINLISTTRLGFVDPGIANNMRELLYALAHGTFVC